MKNLHFHPTLVFSLSWTYSKFRQIFLKVFKVIGKALFSDLKALHILFAIPNNISLEAQRLKHLPPMRETWVQSLGQENSLEKEMATHSSILAWRIPWTEEPGRLQFMGSQRVGHDWATSLSLSLSIIFQSRQKGPSISYLKDQRNEA